MKHSLLWSRLSKYFHSPELPRGVQIQTHCRGSPVLDSSPPATCQSPCTSLLFINHSAPLYHSSILQHLSAIYHPCFLPTSFLKPLAKGCKYSQPILPGTWSLGIPALYSTELSNIQLLQKQVAKGSVHLETSPQLFVYFLPSSSEPTTSQQSCPVISE